MTTLPPEDESQLIAPPAPDEEPVAELTPPTDIEPPADAAPVDPLVVPAEPPSEAAAALPPTVILAVGTDIEKIWEMIVERRAKLGTAAQDQATRQPGTFDNLLANLFIERENNAEAERIEDTIARLSPEARERFTTRMHDASGRVIGGPLMTPGVTAAAGGKKVAGHDGYMEFTRRTPGSSKRISLYGSGFHVDVKQPTRPQLDNLIASSNITVQEYGRLFGAHFFTYADLVLKRYVAEMLVSCVMATNLKDGLQPAVLLDHFKLTDLPGAMMGLASLMHPKGYPDFRHVCTNAKCNHVITQTVDLSKFTHTQYARLSDKALQLMKAPYPGSPSEKGEKVTAEQLRAYQTELAFAREIRFQQYGLQLEVPSLARYLSYGETFNQEILQRHQASLLGPIESALAARTARMFTPWVAKLVSYDGQFVDGQWVDARDPATEQPVVDRVTEDLYTISHVLDDLQGLDEDDGLYQQLLEFTGDAQLTHVCYPAAPCPECGTVPETRTGFLTVDPINAFFTLCLSK